MRHGSQPCAPIDRAAVVVTLAEVGLTRVQRHADQQRRGRGPRLGIQRLLAGSGSGHGIGGPAEDGEAAVALPGWADDVPMMLSDDLLDQRIMPH